MSTGTGSPPRKVMRTNSLTELRKSLNNTHTNGVTLGVSCAVTAVELWWCLCISSNSGFSVILQVAGQLNFFLSICEKRQIHMSLNLYKVFSQLSWFLIELLAINFLNKFLFFMHIIKKNEATSNERVASMYNSIDNLHNYIALNHKLLFHSLLFIISIILSSSRIVWKMSSIFFHKKCITFLFVIYSKV